MEYKLARSNQLPDKSVVNAPPSTTRKALPRLPSSLPSPHPPRTSVDKCPRFSENAFMPSATRSPNQNSDNPSSPTPTNTHSPYARQDAPVLGRNTDRILIIYMVAVVTATTIVLKTQWDHHYSYPLREWLIVNALLTVFRTIGRITMHYFPRHRLTTLRITLIWALRLLTILSIAWFIVGIVFLAKENPDQPNSVYHLMRVIIVFELVLLGLCALLGVIIFLFALRPVLAAHRNTPAATKEDLAKLRTFKFDHPEGADDTAATCTICLSEYQKDEVLRELPCATGSHIFHAQCVDEWLMKKLSCPICRDDPLRKSKAPAQEADSPV